MTLIGAGASQKVTLELDKKAFYSFNDDTQAFETRPGKYQILYGSSSLDKDLKTVELTIE